MRGVPTRPQESDADKGGGDVIAGMGSATFGAAPGIAATAEHVQPK